MYESREKNGEENGKKNHGINNYFISINDNFNRMWYIKEQG